VKKEEKRAGKRGQLDYSHGDKGRLYY
jgi:hypothetical protein